MNSKPYPNKTDRQQQFERFKNDIGWTRKQLKLWEHYFFTGELLEERVEQSTWLLFLHPEQSIDHWQYALSNQLDLNNKNMLEIRSDELLDKFFFPHLQKACLQLLYYFFFHPEDRAWIFTQMFGETYEPERQFPLLLPGEAEYREFTLSIVEIISSIFVEINSCLRGKEDSYYVLYIESYISSCIPYIPLESFNVSMPEDGEERKINRSLNRIIHFAHQPLDSASEEDKPKIELARKVKAIFDNYEGDLGEYQQLVELVEREGPQV